MLEFKTGTCSVKRLGPKVWYKSDYVTVYSNIEIDIQPEAWQSLGIDKVKDSYKAYISTSNRELVIYNDIIVDEENKEYTVQNSEFWKGNGRLEDSLEVDLILNRT